MTKAKKGPLAVCVINLKGGVGKSTVTALLSRYAFQQRKLDVLTVDLDPQANLSQALMRRSYATFVRDKRPSIVELFNGYQPPSTTSSSTSPLSEDSLTQTVARIGNRSLDLIASRFDFSDNLTTSLRPDPKALGRYLATHFQHKDLILIDCSPTESIFTHAAYHASGFVLVPVKPEYFATIGFPLLQESLADFRRHNRGSKIEVAGVVINNAFYDGGNDGGPEKLRAMRDIKEECEKNKWKIFENELPHSRGFPKMMRGDYSYLGNATQFYHFANEFFTHVYGP